MSMHHLSLEGLLKFISGLVTLCVFMSKVDGKFQLSPISVNFLTEITKVVFAIIMLIIQGNIMEAYIPKAQINIFMTTIVEDHVYYIEYFKVIDAKEQYRAVDHHLQSQVLKLLQGDDETIHWARSQVSASFDGSDEGGSDS